MGQQTYAIDLAVPADVAWRVAGEGFAEIGAWATAVPASRPYGGARAPAHAPVAGRTCATTVPGIPTADERLVAYDPDRRRLTYQAAGVCLGRWCVGPATRGRSMRSVRTRRA